MREKYCLLAEKVRLISQTIPSEQGVFQPSSRHTEFPTVFGATKGFKAPVVTKWQQVVTLSDTITISPLDGRGLSRIKNMMIAVTLDVQDGWPCIAQKT